MVLSMSHMNWRDKVENKKTSQNKIDNNSKDKTLNKNIYREK